MTASVLLAISFAAAPAQPARPGFSQLARQAAEAREANRAEEAIGFYRQALKLRPEWEEGLWYAGFLLYDKERYPESRDVLRRLVAHAPAAAPGWAILGLCEFQTREYARSLAHLQRSLALGLGKDRASILFAVQYHLGVLLSRFERFDEAADLLLGLSRAARPTGAVLDALGLAGLRLPWLPAEVPPDRRDLVRLAGTAVYETMVGSDAARRDLVARYPAQPNVHLLCAVALLAANSPEGIVELKRELEVAPENAAALARLSAELLDRGDHDAALPLAERAVKADPSSFTAHLALGRTLAKKGQLDTGIAELETARKLAPGNAAARWALISAYTQAGRSADAARERAEVEALKDLR